MAPYDHQSTIQCPDCGNHLKKCLIQQNYAMVICPNLECGYPFNQSEVINHIVHINDKDIIEVAKDRLSNK